MLKILCYDTDQNLDRLLQPLLYFFKKSEHKIVSEKNIHSFHNKIKVERWHVCVVNFQQRVFFEQGDIFLMRICQDIKSYQSDNLFILGVTSDEGQIKCLKNLGITTIPKDYDPNTIIKSLSGTEVEHSLLGFEEITRIVCEHFEMEYELIFSHSSKRDVTKVRQVCVYFCRIITEKSQREIADFFGNMERSNVSTICKIVKHLFEVDSTYKGNILILKQKFDLLRS